MGLSVLGGGSMRPDSRLHAQTKRDVAGAKALFNKAIKYQGHPLETITLDGYAA
jgi:hypothetical protein